MPTPSKSPVLKTLSIAMALFFLFACVVAAAQDRFDGTKSGKPLPKSKRALSDGGSDSADGGEVAKPVFFPATKAAPVPLRERNPPPQQQAQPANSN